MSLAEAFRAQLKPRKLALPIAVFTLLASAPFTIGEGYWLHVLIFAMYYAVLAQFWNLEAGYTGQFSFAYMAYSGIGAYTSALTVIHLKISPALGFLLGALVAMVAGLFLGYLTLRMRAVYLALTTIAFSEIMRIVLTAEYWLTRGALGLSVPPLLSTPSKAPYFYIILGIFAASVVVVHVIVNSKYGLFIRAIREDEHAASCMGVNTVRYRVMVTTIGALFSGLVGAFYAHYVLLISPNMIVFSEMAKVICMSVVGGMETIYGPIIGAFFIQFLDEYLRTMNPVINEFFKRTINFTAKGEWRLLVFGAILLATIRLTPQGLIAPLVSRVAKRRGR
ncbi:MAG: branched-chain amino acid ABC transporter permease [Thermoproteota archaeon]|nr:MAG: branched-chain amino acid ABC transporter permease [Candidatus Korarchaeota archaeon]RLG51476.1 MAG: branched-chain amino acid ABC transporter permease [Candidatus Korarchaeota archaeon]